MPVMELEQTAASIQAIITDARFQTVFHTAEQKQEPVENHHSGNRY
jgi:hypothetical protein